MLTDAFSPPVLDNGTTKAALQLLLGRTRFRIRILTKNAIVGAPEWIEFFGTHPGRFVVGLSIGTLDDNWARSIEIGTSPPTERLEALGRLQDAGVPTYAMLCPVFPDVMDGMQVEQLIDRCDPAIVERVWAEPFNDRVNWEVVRSGYPNSSFGYNWFTEAFERGNWALWSDYATALYARIYAKSVAEGWLSKLRFLLYERDVHPTHAARLRTLEGILLQSKPAVDGYSRNTAVAAIQLRTCGVGDSLTGRRRHQYHD
jgi:DNA repair photolyase